MQTIRVKHNCEMAHRLSLSPGKCENIHGHSWWVELEIAGAVHQTGMILEFGAVKKAFREYLDHNFDHRLLLNRDDPILEPPITKRFPGVQVFEHDPTTENFAAHIGLWAQQEFGEDYYYHVIVWETSVNCATWSG